AFVAVQCSAMPLRCCSMPSSAWACRYENDCPMQDMIDAPTPRAATNEAKRSFRRREPLGMAGGGSAASGRAKSSADSACRGSVACGCNGVSWVLTGPSYLTFLRINHQRSLLPSCESCRGDPFGVHGGDAVAVSFT